MARFSLPDAVDDMGLTPRAFRVYVHLARRSRDGAVFGESYGKIGRVCFAAEYTAKGKPANRTTARQWAMRAMNELEERGLVHRAIDDSARTNLYNLTPEGEWRHSDEVREICEDCGQASEAMEQHHPEGRKTNPRLTVPLCPGCHRRRTIAALQTGGSR
jgi:hypothetical protein